MISFYRKIITECKILKKHELVELWKRWKQHKDEDAYHQLIFSQLRLAYQIADRLKRFYPHECEDDVKSEATLAVINALKWWDPKKGNLSTITTIICYQRICKYLLVNRYIIRIPYHVLRQINKLEKVVHPEVQELIKNLSYLNEHTQVRSDSSPLDNLITAESNERLRAALDKLPPLKKEIIQQYYGFFGAPKTVQTLAKKYNMSESDMLKLLSDCHEELKRNIVNELQKDEQQ